jgi:hypothetical protein
MPIRRFVPTGVFAPELVAMMGNVSRMPSRRLAWLTADDPVTTLVAHRIIELVQSGERDPERLKQLTLEAVKGRGPSLQG